MDCEECFIGKKNVSLSTSGKVHLITPCHAGSKCCGFEPGFVPHQLCPWLSLAPAQLTPRKATVAPISGTSCSQESPQWL